MHNNVPNGLYKIFIKIFIVLQIGRLAVLILQQRHFYKETKMFWLRDN